MGRSQRKELRSDARKSVLDAYRKAEKEKRPPLSSMMEDVYEELTDEQREQSAKLAEIIEKYPNEYDVSEFEGGLDSLKALK